jgi:hypothetical protein
VAPTTAWLPVSSTPSSLEPVFQDANALLRTPASGLPTATVGSIVTAVAELLEM